jgi:hypothetical protein
MALNRICCKKCGGTCLKQKFEVWCDIDEFVTRESENECVETDEYFCSDCEEIVDIEIKPDAWIVDFYNEDFNTEERSEECIVLVKMNVEPTNKFVTQHLKNYASHYKYWGIYEYEGHRYDAIFGN